MFKKKLLKIIVEKLEKLPRIYKQFIMIILDVTILSFSLFVSFLLKLGDKGFHVVLNKINDSLIILILIPLISIPLFIKFGLYRSVLRYIGYRVILTCFQATTISTAMFGFLFFLFRDQDISRLIIIIFWFIANTLIISSRFLFKYLLYSIKFKGLESKNILIYGSGNAAFLMSDIIVKDRNYNLIGFVGSDNERGNIINSLPVHSSSKLDKLIYKFNIDIILICISDIDFKNQNFIYNEISNFPVEVKIVPDLSRFIKDNISIDNFNSLSVTDVMGRKHVNPIEGLFEKNIKNKNILITGAGGSIGSELSKQVLSFKPNKLILLDHSEYALYKINQDLKQFENIISISLSSVTSFDSLNRVVKESNIDTIYHAAAYKHVPIVEINPLEGLYNNIFGAYNVAKVSFLNNVSNVIFISTDKAVVPKSIMGLSKRFSEIILQSFQRDVEKNKKNTCYTIVRFGNVINSAGSVVPLFEKQIKSFGPVTVTHPEVTRYFMSIKEAVELVIQAGAMGSKKGDVFILDMGEPVKILDIAKKMIHLNGYKVKDSENPKGDILIKFTGMRKGEKLHEDLFDTNNIVQSEHPRILKLNNNHDVLFKLIDLEKFIKFLENKYILGDSETMIEELRKYIN